MYSAQILKALCMHGAVALITINGKLPSLEEKMPMAVLADAIIKMTRSPTSNLKNMREMTLQLYDLLKKTFSNISVLSEWAADKRDYYQRYTQELCLATKAIIIQGDGTGQQKKDLHYRSNLLVCLADRATELSYSAVGVDDMALQGFKQIKSGKGVPKKRWYYFWNSHLQVDATAQIKQLENSNEIIFSLLGAGHNEIQRLASAQNEQRVEIAVLKQEQQAMEQRIAQLVAQAVAQVQANQSVGSGHRRPSFATMHGTFADSVKDNSLPVSLAAAEPTVRRSSLAWAD